MFLEAQIKRSVVYVTGLVLIAFATIHVSLFLVGEHHVYVNDFRNYWIAYWQSSLRFTESIYTWARHLRAEIWASDYNSLFAAPLLPFSLTFGYARIGFIIAVAITYLIPTVLLSAIAACLVVRDKNTPTITFITFSAIAVLYTPYWRPTLLGFPDIVGLIPLALAFIFMKTARFGNRIRPSLALLFGMLIWMPFLFRRWYAFSIVAFALSAPLYCFVVAVVEGRNSWRIALKNTVLNFAIAGVASVLLVLLTQGGLVQTVLKTSYSTIYIAYQRPMSGHLRDIVDNFGLVYLALALLGHALLFLSPIRRIDILFIDANLVLLFALFTHTQGFGPQHYLPVAFWLLLLICLGVWLIISFTTTLTPFIRIGILTTLVLMFFASFYRSDAWPKWTGALFPITTYNNQIGNEAEYVKLAKAVNKYVKPSEKFTVFASSMVLNRDVLLSASREVLAGKDLDISHVDLIQGLSVVPFTAKFAVVADPVQIHLPPTTQSVVTIPTLAILSGQGIGAAYRRLNGEFAISNGVKAYIYEKTRPFTADEVDAFLAEFYKVYPEWRQTYGTSAVKLALTSAVELGDRWGRLDFVQDAGLIAHPGHTTPTVITFPGVGGILRLAVRPPCAGADGVTVRLTEGETVVYQADIGPAGTTNLPLTDKDKTYTLTLSKRGNPWCDAVTISE
jgi:hypothetical protein